MTEKRPRPVKHLAPDTRKWVSSVQRDYELAPHHVRLLTLAGEAWDRCEEARKALAKHGTTFVDRFGQPHARPEIGVERDSRIAFVRILRELDLDVEVPSETRRPPQLPRYQGGLRVS